MGEQSDFTASSDQQAGETEANKTSSSRDADSHPIILAYLLDFVGLSILCPEEDFGGDLSETEKEMGKQSFVCFPIFVFSGFLLSAFFGPAGCILCFLGIQFSTASSLAHGFFVGFLAHFLSHGLLVTLADGSRIASDNSQTKSGKESNRQDLLHLNHQSSTLGS